MGDYKYTISDCDVHDKNRLDLYRKKRTQWLEWMDGEDVHAVWKQITQMFWLDTIFRTLNEARRIASENPREEVGFNSSLLKLLDSGYITIQTTSIRRLIEKQSPYDKKAIISLRQALDDIRANRILITRENYIAYDGLPYDPEPLRKKWLMKQAESGGEAEWLQTEGPEAWGTSEEGHDNFDELSGIPETSRDRFDLIEEKWFDDADRKLDICDDIRRFVNRFIAHASDPSTRRGLEEDELGISLNKLSESQKVLYQVASFVHGPLLWASTYLSPIPYPQYDHLANLDKQLIVTEDRDKLDKAWEARVKEVERWRQEDDDG